MIENSTVVAVVSALENNEAFVDFLLAFGIPALWMFWGLTRIAGDALDQLRRRRSA